jgi:hypothetical protein
MKFNSLDEYKSNYESKTPGIVLDSLVLSNMDSLQLPVKAVYYITSSSLAEKMGDLIGFNPFLFERMTDFPLKNETRMYPVDFATPKEYKFINIFRIPDGYELAENPSSLNLVLPEKKARFTYNISTNENQIQLNATLELSSAVFTEREYPLLRQFYTEIMAKESEYILLKRKTKQ